MICHQCGAELHLHRVPGRLDICSHCNAYLHSCLNCRLYDPTVANSCQEPQAEFVSDKAVANFCEFFQPGTNREASHREAKAKDAKKIFDDLFGE